MEVEVAPPATQSHRERKKVATRQAIHEAAFELVDERGLGAVTVEAISERAGVAPRTFWAYFGSKEDAVLNRVPGRAEALRQGVLARPASEDPLTALRRVLEDDLANRPIDPEKLIRRARVIREEPQLMSALAAIFDEIERSLTLGIAERLGVDPEQDMYPGIIVSAVAGACRVAHERWSERGCRPSLASMFNEAFDYLAGGLAPHLPERTRR